MKLAAPRIILSDDAVLFIGGVTLFLGGIIYLSFRPETLVMFSWVTMLGLDEFVNSMRDYTNDFAIPQWVIFSAPNGLWIFSFGALMLWLWERDSVEHAACWTFALWLLAISSEALQLIEVIPGTFDVNDLVAYTVGFLMALFLSAGRSYE